jgi:hypothetical protein
VILPEQRQADDVISRQEVSSGNKEVVAEDAWLASLPDAVRITAGEALNRLHATVATSRVNETPFAHPIYWAAAVVYGA